MPPNPQPDGRVVPPLAPPPALQAALRLLLKSHEYASELGRPVWDFGVELRELREAGLSGADLRWLVCRGLLAHATEIAPGGGRRRRFRKTTGLAFDERECFALTPTGVGAARDQLASPGAEAVVRIDAPTGLHGPHVTALPRWDGERRELRLMTQVVKRFRQPAPSQEAILAAFEARAWAPRIEKVLSPLATPAAREQLHYTIKNLNRNQMRSLLRFRGDGTGLGVCWGLLDGALPQSHPGATP